ncbi:MAG TPA: pyridoxamine 5'-phosphate oxidase family protein [Silvibacterium sp.]|nr:pyridoxamine 5'-phosphate oxidase family protein [Silvibacterium sp.]
MGRFAEIAFTPLVKEQQEKHGSRYLYERAERSNNAVDRLGEFETEFIRERDGFYMASTSETGWPYIQYRGGAKGFLRILDDRTLGFADLRGNKQYISMGNLQHDNRVALFFMDYAHQLRLKILGRAEVHEGDETAQKLLRDLIVPEEKTPAERAILIHVEGFDWNCPQHITPRYTIEELEASLAPMQRRIEFLEAENRRLKSGASR